MTSVNPQAFHWVKQTRFSTNINSEPKIAVFKEWQLRVGLENKKVCIIQEGNRKHLSEAMCEFAHPLYMGNPQRWCFPTSANIYYFRWTDVLNKVKLLMKFSVSFHMETMSDIIKAAMQSTNSYAYQILYGFEKTFMCSELIHFFSYTVWEEPFFSAH